MVTSKKHLLERWTEPALDRTPAVVAALAPHAHPLVSDRDLDPLLERIGDARFVLLGEASHGTSEFYAWRARVTRRLVAERGFSF
ncbi:MAG TPA: erythromycin esterase family protein, partial [Byssovorax sp.]